MSNWVFALIVFGIGLGLAFWVDRQSGRSGGATKETREQCERRRWLTFWYSGRLPDQKECDGADDASENENGGGAPGGEERTTKKRR